MERSITTREQCIDRGGHFWPPCDDGTKPSTCMRCGYNPGWVADVQPDRTDDSVGRKDAQKSTRRAAAIQTLGKWARGDDCEHGYYAAGGTEYCPACFDDGGEYEHQHDPFTDENGEPFEEDR